MHVANVSSGGELWLSTESQSTASVTPMQHNSEHPPAVNVTAAVRVSAFVPYASYFL